ncbi:MAG: hypothetical protein ACM3JI_01405 [Anaerolineae bacterium]
MRGHGCGFRGRERLIHFRAHERLTFLHTLSRGPRFYSPLLERRVHLIARREASSWIQQSIPLLRALARAWFGHRHVQTQRSFPSSYLHFQTHQPIYRPSEIPARDGFSAHVEERNNEMMNQARATNHNGVAFISSLITKYKQSLKADKKQEFEDLLSSMDAKIFELVPRLAVRQLMEQKEALTEKGCPHFMLKGKSLEEQKVSLQKLQKLQKDFKALSKADQQDVYTKISEESAPASAAAKKVWQDCRAIANDLHQGNANFRASMEGALKNLS